MFSKRLALIMACVLLFPVVNVSVKQEGENLPELVISYTDDGVVVTPSEVPAGLTRIVMENPGKEIGGSPITRLKEGYTQQDLMAAMIRWMK